MEKYLEKVKQAWEDSGESLNTLATAINSPIHTPMEVYNQLEGASHTDKARNLIKTWKV